jgi:hypothetical protein
MLRSRERVAFVTGRRSAAGDPQRPSRIVFHCADAEVVPRVKRFLHAASPRRSRAGVASHEDRRALPQLASPQPVESLPVTAFRDYLQSPYLFYLRHVAGIESLDDRARELDPMHFGSLAHEVLQRFGQDEDARDLRDAGRIAAWLIDSLRAVARQRYGARPLPAVQLQVEQLAQRLAVFAEHQAARRAEGWQIHATEWSPEGGRSVFPVDGVPFALRGRIDRIDRHAERDAWSIWDYKTGEQIASPINQHRRRDGTWKDLQLPLYCQLATPLLGDAQPCEVGFIGLSRDGSKKVFDGVDRWQKGGDESFADGVEHALETARDVVRRVREGDFFSADGFETRDAILAAIAGIGVVDGGGDE